MVVGVGRNYDQFTFVEIIRKQLVTLYYVGIPYIT